MAILLVALFVFLFVAAYIVNGWALVHLWGWFLTPLGLPAVDLPWAIGISIVVGFLTNSSVPKENETIDGVKASLYLFLRPLLALLVGYVVKLFM